MASLVALDNYTSKVYGPHSTGACLSLHRQNPIRIRFREGLFKGRGQANQIHSLCVHTCLCHRVTNLFSEDQTPPKRDLKVSDPNVRDLTLAEIHLAPSSVLLLRFEDEALNGTTTSWE